MNRIIKTDGTELCLVDEVRYIKRSAYGVFVEASMTDAIGISVNGTVFNLLGHDDIEGAETVLVSRASTADELTAHKASIDEQQNVMGITFVMLTKKGDIDDVTASEHADLFEPWVASKAYAVGDIVSYNGLLYRCVQAHTSQADWTPDLTPALWTRMADPSVEYPEWSQPLGAHDAYALGAKVSHNGKKWVSDIANNVWEPGVYGWSEVTETEQEGVSEV